MMQVGETLAQVLSGYMSEIARGRGPVKWCKYCGRKHPRRGSCGLVKVAVPARSGRIVERWMHPSRTAGGDS